MLSFLPCEIQALKIGWQTDKRQHTSVKVTHSRHI